MGGRHSKTAKAELDALDSGDDDFLFQVHQILCTRVEQLAIDINKIAEEHSTNGLSDEEKSLFQRILARHRQITREHRDSTEKLKCLIEQAWMMLGSLPTSDPELLIRWVQPIMDQLCLMCDLVTTDCSSSMLEDIEELRSKLEHQSTSPYVRNTLLLLSGFGLGIAAAGLLALIVLHFTPAVAFALPATALGVVGSAFLASSTTGASSFVLGVSGLRALSNSHAEVLSVLQWVKAHENAMRQAMTKLRGRACCDPVYVSHVLKEWRETVSTTLAIINAGDLSELERMMKS